LMYCLSCKIKVKMQKLFMLMKKKYHFQNKVFLTFIR